MKTKDCPEGKEINPLTGRCVNKCKDGEVRDAAKGKCLKIKKVIAKCLKIKKVITKCPEGKEINPLTGRCVNKCKDGEVRDAAKGKCVKIKKVIAKCPEGKEINPLTGRCVNKCKDGEVRNAANGKCVKLKVKSLNIKLKTKDCPKGKEINPKTGRCVNKCKDGEVRNAVTGKCIKLKVKKDTKDKLNKMISYLSSPPEPSKSSPSIFIDSPISINQYALRNRLKLYKKAVHYLNKIDKNECLKSKKNGKDENIMSLSNKLFLDKRIGTKSVYGAIYLSNIRNVPDLLVVSKVSNRTINNLNEISIMNDLKENLVKTGKTKHVPLIYSSHICNTRGVRDSKSLVSVNELCNGDLKILVDDPKNYPFDDKTLYNILFQVFISIATYQEYSKKMHADCHYGNILYQINSEKGYYKYKYKQDEFYLESCPYNMMLYDFGLAKKPNVNSEFYNDFYRIIHAFIPEKNGGWNLHIRNDKFIRNVIIIKDYIKYKMLNKHDYSFDIILQQIVPHLKDIYKTNKTQNDVILNKTPFIIG